MGAVYRGTDTHTGQLVAIKIIKPELASRNSQIVERFVREAEALRALNHPNIVSVIATITEGEPCLVMEFVPGRSLRDMIDQDKAISVNQTLEIALDLSDALTRAHRLKIIHRDIKPENVLLAEDGTPRLTDFGLARLAGGSYKESQLLTEEGAILGTLDYLSPEACRGEALDERADIWAFGVTLFEMLTKKRPFTGPSVAATLTAILTKPAPELKTLRPDTPDLLISLIGRMLEKEREQRIPSVRQVGAELELVLRGAGSDFQRKPVPRVILETKLKIPLTRPALVPRPRLIDKLNSGALARLMLIAAPAGFGKTTLLANWTKERDLNTAWVSLDYDDNDPTIFLTYIASALRLAAPMVGSVSLTMLRSTPSMSTDDVLPTLTNELSSIQSDLFLILDDYHFIESEEIHSALTTMVDNLPRRMHIVISSRSDPPLPLSRWRVRGQLVELRQKDLRFSLEEAAEFLSNSAGLNLSPEHVSMLEVKTEGWIAGLQLAALSLAEKEDTSTFVQEFSGSHRFVLDYLADEVISHLPKSLRNFMLSTAILDRLTAPLCDALVEQADSSSFLSSLENTNLFLIPLDDRREWYRYHHLFSEFLRYQLTQEEKTALHAKASEWFLSNAYYNEGVKHALACGDVDRAIDAITRAAPDAFNNGSLTILLGWLNAVPEDRLLRNCDLAIYKGFTLFLVESDRAAIPYLAAAEQNLSPDLSKSTQGHFLALKAHIAMCANEVDEAILFAREALDLLDVADHSFRNLTYNVLGQVLELSGDVASAAEVYEQAFKLGMQTSDQMGALAVFANLIFSLNERGKRHEALALCHQLTASLTARGVPLLDAVNLPQSLLSYEANELYQAFKQSQRALTLLSAANFHQGILWGKYIQARIHLARGEFTELFQITREGRNLASQVGRESIQGAWFAALEAQAHIEQLDLAEAARWAKEMGYSPLDIPHHWQEYPYFTYVRLLLAQDRPAEATALLRNMEQSAQKGGRIRKLITIHLLHACSLLSQEYAAEARDRVEQALNLAEIGDYQRAFLDERQKISSFLPQVRAAAPAFIDKLLEGSGSNDVPSPKGLLLIDPLSRREQEVLELVAAGLSNREVAEVLFVTVGTVKKHLNNIFSKLHVKSRTQAAARGRELGLLN